eukprot:TRINITY_DN1282_c0_g1_i10.p1 TRINITY_DN1282_c0_g1~~TRINITY_DN1282_c0_g1_i10.p1  ORF type:complete len:257 (-),score=52.28 TRINITY_DN1282_c0_g1_i10:48-818(-)
MNRRPPRSTLSSSSAASDVYKRQEYMGLNSKTIKNKFYFLKQIQKMNDEQHWNLFSRFYVNFFEQSHQPMAQILFDALNIEKAENVLEVGAGSGRNLQHFLIQKPQKCHWYATDLCELMLSMCQQRIEEFIKNPFLKQEHNYLTEEFPKYEEKTIEALNLSIKKANVHDLSQFASNSFDRYFANQVIGNREDRPNILKEAWRVLKPEGLIGFTVFGRRENCTWYTIAKNVAIEQGCLLYTSPSPRDRQKSRMPSSA